MFKQSLSQLSQRVPELWSDKQTNIDHTNIYIYNYQMIIAKLIFLSIFQFLKEHNHEIEKML